MKTIQSRWRRVSAPIIAAVLEKHPEEGPEQRKALQDAYPFGPREHHPYKIWLDEIQKQRGGRKVLLLDDSRKLVFGSRVDPYGDREAK